MKGIKYHIQKHEKKEEFIKAVKKLIIAIGIAIVLGIIIARYLLHKAGLM